MSNIIAPEWEDRSRTPKRQGERAESDSAPSGTAIESIEAALNSLVELLRASAHCVEAAVFEYRRVPGQPVVAGRFACGPGKQPASSLLATVIADKRSQIGAPDCFAIGRERANYVLGLRLSARMDQALRSLSAR